MSTSMRKIDDIKRDLSNLSKGEIDTIDKDKTTSLHLACSQNNSAITEYLLQLHHDINPFNRVGRTPLHWACLFGVESNVRLLIKHGVDINCRAMNGDTPVHICAGTNNTRLITILYENESLIDEPNNLGLSPLHVACECEFEEVCKLLIRYGADITRKGLNGVAPLDISTPFIDELKKHMKLLIGQNEISAHQLLALKTYSHSPIRRLSTKKISFSEVYQDADDDSFILDNRSISPSPFTHPRNISENSDTVNMALVPAVLSGNRSKNTTSSLTKSLEKETILSPDVDAILTATCSDLSQDDIVPSPVRRNSSVIHTPPPPLELNFTDTQRATPSVAALIALMDTFEAEQKARIEETCRMKEDGVMGTDVRPQAFNLAETQRHHKDNIDNGLASGRDSGNFPPFVSRNPLALILFCDEDILLDDHTDVNEALNVNWLCQNCQYANTASLSQCKRCQLSKAVASLTYLQGGRSVNQVVFSSKFSHSSNFLTQPLPVSAGSNVSYNTINSVKLNRRETAPANLPTLSLISFPVRCRDQNKLGIEVVLDAEDDDEAEDLIVAQYLPSNTFVDDKTSIKVTVSLDEVIGECKMNHSEEDVFESKDIPEKEHSNISKTDKVSVVETFSSEGEEPKMLPFMRSVLATKQANYWMANASIRQQEKRLNLVETQGVSVKDKLAMFSKPAKDVTSKRIEPVGLSVKDKTAIFSKPGGETLEKQQGKIAEKIDAVIQPENQTHLEEARCSSPPKRHHVSNENFKSEEPVGISVKDRAALFSKPAAGETSARAPLTPKRVDELEKIALTPNKADEPQRSQFPFVVLEENSGVIRSADFITKSPALARAENVLPNRRSPYRHEVPGGGGTGTRTSSPLKRSQTPEPLSVEGCKQEELVGISVKDRAALFSKPAAGEASARAPLTPKRVDESEKNKFTSKRVDESEKVTPSPKRLEESKTAYIPASPTAPLVKTTPKPLSPSRPSFQEETASDENHVHNAAVYESVLVKARIAYFNNLKNKAEPTIARRSTTANDNSKGLLPATIESREVSQNKFRRAVTSIMEANRSIRKSRLEPAAIHGTRKSSNRREYQSQLSRKFDAIISDIENSADMLSTFAPHGPRRSLKHSKSTPVDFYEQEHTNKELSPSGRPKNKIISSIDFYVPPVPQISSEMSHTQKVNAFLQYTKAVGGAAGSGITVRPPPPPNTLENLSEIVVEMNDVQSHVESTITSPRNEVVHVVHVKLDDSVSGEEKKEKESLRMPDNAMISSSSSSGEMYQQIVVQDIQQDEADDELVDFDQESVALDSQASIPPYLTKNHSSILSDVDMYPLSSKQKLFIKRSLSSFSESDNNQNVNVSFGSHTGLSDVDNITVSKRAVKSSGKVIDRPLSDEKPSANKVKDSREVFSLLAKTRESFDELHKDNVAEKIFGRRHTTGTENVPLQFKSIGENPSPLKPDEVTEVRDINNTPTEGLTLLQRRSLSRLSVQEGNASPALPSLAIDTKISNNAKSKGLEINKSKSTADIENKLLLENSTRSKEMDHSLRTLSPLIVQEAIGNSLPPRSLRSQNDNSTSNTISDQRTIKLSKSESLESQYSTDNSTSNIISDQRIIKLSKSESLESENSTEEIELNNGRSSRITGLKILKRSLSHKESSKSSSSEINEINYSDKEDIRNPNLDDGDDEQGYVARDLSSAGVGEEHTDGRDTDVSAIVEYAEEGAPEYFSNGSRSNRNRSSVQSKRPSGALTRRGLKVAPSIIPRRSIGQGKSILNQSPSPEDENNSPIPPPHKKASSASTADDSFVENLNFTEIALSATLDKSIDNVSPHSEHNTNVRSRRSVDRLSRHFDKMNAVSHNEEKAENPVKIFMPTLGKTEKSVYTSHSHVYEDKKASSAQGEQTNTYDAAMVKEDEVADTSLFNEVKLWVKNKYNSFAISDASDITGAELEWKLSEIEKNFANSPETLQDIRNLLHMKNKKQKKLHKLHASSLARQSSGDGDNEKQPNSAEAQKYKRSNSKFLERSGSLEEDPCNSIDTLRVEIADIRRKLKILLRRGEDSNIDIDRSANNR